MQTIALYTTDTMADWEYAYLTTQITAAEQIRPGRFRLLLVGDGTGPVTSLGGLPLTPQTDLADLPSLAQDGSLGALVIPGGNTCTTQPLEHVRPSEFANCCHFTSHFDVYIACQIWTQSTSNGRPVPVPRITSIASSLSNCSKAAGDVTFCPDVLTGVGVPTTFLSTSHV